MLKCKVTVRVTFQNTVSCFGVIGVGILLWVDSPIAKGQCRITLIELNLFNGLLQATVLLIIKIKSLLVREKRWEMDRYGISGVPLASLSALGLRDLRSLGGRIQVRTTAYRAGEEVRIALCSGATAELAMKDLEDLRYGRAICRHKHP